MHPDDALARGRCLPGAVGGCFVNTIFISEPFYFFIWNHCRATEKLQSECGAPLCPSASLPVSHVVAQAHRAAAQAATGTLLAQ